MEDSYFWPIEVLEMIFTHSSSTTRKLECIYEIMFLKNWKTVSVGLWTLREGEKKTRWSLCLYQLGIWGEFPSLSTRKGILNSPVFSPSSQDSLRFKPSKASGICEAEHIRRTSYMERELWKPARAHSGLLLWAVQCMDEKKLQPGPSKQNNPGSSYKIENSLTSHQPEWKEFMISRISGRILRKLSSY